VRAHCGKQQIDLIAGRLRGEIPIPQPHVEGRMLAAHETGDANAVSLAERQWKQRQRHVLPVVSHNDEGMLAFACSGLLLPGTKEVKPLIGSKKMLLIFEAPPNGFGVIKVGEEIDVSDAARFRPCRRICRTAFDCGSQGHRKTYLEGILLTFQGSRLLQRNVNKA
jgi:hypothetical protein